MPQLHYPEQNKFLRLLSRVAKHVSGYAPDVNCLITSKGLDIIPGARTQMLHQQAYTEEAMKLPDEGKFPFPGILLYPRSFITRINALPEQKIYDFNFVGALFNPDTYAQRKWIEDYAKQHFTDNSYYCITDPEADYVPIGRFDYTLDHVGQGFIPKQTALEERDFFDSTYFAIMRQSRFTLCPAGDAPWSMRYFESIMCHSIPIIEHPRHSGRNALERALTYHYFLHSQPVHYANSLSEENYNKFLHFQTLID